VEYRIDPARMDEFMEVMQESRRSRMSHGALDWQVVRDLYDEGRVVEHIVDESWTEHLRRFDRVTQADVALRDRKLAFHTGDSPPVVARYLIEK
jgi:quinol monooxygenase YgiN